MNYKNILPIGVLATFLSFTAIGCSDDETKELPDTPSTEQGDNPSGEESNPEADQPDVYPTPDRSTIAAFPGAEGAGKYTTGGAGGKVYIVTSLEDNGNPGTLRYAIEQSGKRTVVFAVGGVIKLNKQLVIKNDDITIAGQTAPGAGICLKDYTLRINANNVIIRFLRCRMGDEAQTEDDAMNGYQSNYPGKRNILIDHCSISWSTDECASFYGNTNFTMQWCVISESLWHSVHEKGNHGYGGIWGGSPATFHHNLLAHHSNRTPRLCGSRYSNRADMEKVDLCNNVIYNWTNNGAYAGEGGSYNLLNNYYKPGPATAKQGTTIRFFQAYPDDGTNKQAKGITGMFYLSGNIMDGACKELSEKQVKAVQNANKDNTNAFELKDESKTKDEILVNSRFNISPDYQFLETAQNAYETVVTYAGSWICAWDKEQGYAVPKRDKIDLRIADDVKNTTFSTTASNGGYNGLIDSQTDTPEQWSPYKEATSNLTDSDKDGMPDEWETAHGLNPQSDTDNTQYSLSPSYTNLEVYLNELVEKTFPLNLLLN